jgi:hypothetical protein
MTTHQFAKQLLAGHDIEVAVPKVKEYDDNPDDSTADPVVVIVEGHENGTPCKIALISYPAS